MNYEGYIAIASMILSIAIGVGGLRKGKADAFSTYQDALLKSQQNYDTLEKRFSALEIKYQDLELKFEHMESWNKALIRQLVANKIKPISLEEVLSYCNNDLGGQND
jgi:hypothetical protein